MGLNENLLLDDDCEIARVTGKLGRNANNEEIWNHVNSKRQTSNSILQFLKIGLSRYKL